MGLAKVMAILLAFVVFSSVNVGAADGDVVDACSDKTRFEQDFQALCRLILPPCESCDGYVVEVEVTAGELPRAGLTPVVQGHVTQQSACLGTLTCSASREFAGLQHAYHVIECEGTGAAGRHFTHHYTDLAMTCSATRA